jgi:hypothetical protein
MWVLREVDESVCDGSGGFGGISWMETNRYCMRIPKTYNGWVIFLFSLFSSFFLGIVFSWVRNICISWLVVQSGLLQ